MAFSVGLLIAFPYALFEVRGCRSNQDPPVFFFWGGLQQCPFFFPLGFCGCFEKMMAWESLQKMMMTWERFIPCEIEQTFWHRRYVTLDMGAHVFSEGKSSAIITKQHRFVDVMRLPLPLSAHFLHENPLSESSRWCASRFSFIAANRWRY